IKSRCLACPHSHVRATGNSDGKNSQQTVAQVIHRRIRKHALRILLRGGSPCTHHDRHHGQHQQRRSNLGNLRTEKGQCNSQQTVHTHLRHCTRQQHRHG